MDLSHIQKYCAVVCDSRVEYSLVQKNRIMIETVLEEIIEKRKLRYFLTSANHGGDIATLLILSLMRPRHPIRVAAKSNVRSISGVAPKQVAETFLDIDALYSERCTSRELYDSLLDRATYIVYIRNKSETEIAEYGDVFSKAMEEYTRDRLILELE